MLGGKYREWMVLLTSVALLSALYTGSVEVTAISPPSYTLTNNNDIKLHVALYVEKIRKRTYKIDIIITNKGKNKVDFSELECVLQIYNESRPDRGMYLEYFSSQKVLESGDTLDFSTVWHGFLEKKYPLPHNVPAPSGKYKVGVRVNYIWNESTIPDAGNHTYIHLESLLENKQRIHKSVHDTQKSGHSGIHRIGSWMQPRKLSLLRSLYTDMLKIFSIHKGFTKIFS